MRNEKGKVKRNHGKKEGPREEALILLDICVDRQQTNYCRKEKHPIGCFESRFFIFLSTPRKKTAQANFQSNDLSTPYIDLTFSSPNGSVNLGQSLIMPDRLKLGVGLKEVQIFLVYKQTRNITNSCCISRVIQIQGVSHHWAAENFYFNDKLL